MSNPNPHNQFKPGESGNLKGRPPKEWTMSGLIREATEEESETGVPKKFLIAKKLADKALSGDMVAIKEVNNRLDGMATQKQEVTLNNPQHVIEDIFTKVDNEEHEKES